MLVSKFAVSVQYGQGYHYFLRTDLDTEVQAQDIFKGAAARLLPHKKPGAKPAVHLWERKETKK